MQSQLVCMGCRNLLLYPRGATNVCCAICNTISAAPPPGSEMAQIICGGCRTLLMYPRGASSVRCSCCNTINLARAEDPGHYYSATGQVAHVNCGHCRTTLMYPYGAPSVKCSICQYITNTGMPNVRIPIPMVRPNGSIPPQPPSSSELVPNESQTVVVENPMSVDEHGKLVSNVVVGVSMEKK